MFSKPFMVLSAAIATADAHDFLILSDASSRLARGSRNVMMRLRNSHQHPQVQMASGCSSSIDLLKKGPANIPKIIEKGEQYVDTDFGSDMSTIYWEDNLTPETKKDTALIKDFKAVGWLNWYNWQKKTPDAKIFDGDEAPSIEEPIQGNGGTCYVLAGMASAADRPDLLKQMFLTKEKNAAGIHALRFYIRGKPWVFDIDDKMFFQEELPEDGIAEAQKFQLYFATASKNNLMWGPIIEKGWAKVKGAYMNADGGISSNALRFMTGAPAPEFKWKDVDDNAIDGAFKMLADSVKKGYLINFTTDGSNDQEGNACGIAGGHAYSIHDAFTINDADGNPVNLVMVRNPWGQAKYKLDKEWGPKDERWTDEITKQVIDKTTYDPRTSVKAKGVMFIPHTNMKKCFGTVAIAQIHPGYSDNWYDALDMDNKFHSYYFQVPKKDGDFYITVETYSENIVPTKCTTAKDEEFGEFSSIYYQSPLVSIIVYKANETDKEFKKVASKYYVDIQHIPILINTLNYQANDIFAVDVHYEWLGSKGNDYTVKVYSKMDIKITDSLDQQVQLHTDGASPTEFTESKYCGMDINCTPGENYKGKEKDINTEAYTGDKWYLKSDISKTYFASQRKDNRQKFEEVVVGLEYVENVDDENVKILVSQFVLITMILTYIQ